MNKNGFNINTKTLLGFLGFKLIKAIVSIIFGVIFLAIIFKMMGIIPAFKEVDEKKEQAQKMYNTNLKVIRQQEEKVASALAATDDDVSDLNAKDTAIVTRVIDGDTIVVRYKDGSKEKVRFIGIDCPEDTTKKGILW